MDGGQSVKRSAAAGVADSRDFETDYRIAPIEVDVYANEVKHRVVLKKKVRRVPVRFFADTTIEQGGDRWRGTHSLGHARRTGRAG